MRVKAAGPGDLLALKLPVPPPVYRSIVAQMVLSDTVAAYESADAPAPFAMAGICDLGNGERECWFIVKPDTRWPLLLAFLRRARGVIRSAEFPVIAYVNAGNLAGERMAALLGMTLGQHAIGGARQWRRG